MPAAAFAGWSRWSSDLAQVQVLFGTLARLLSISLERAKPLPNSRGALRPTVTKQHKSQQFYPIALITLTLGSSTTALRKRISASKSRLASCRACPAATANEMLVGCTSAASRKTSAASLYRFCSENSSPTNNSYECVWFDFSSRIPTKMTIHSWIFWRHFTSETQQTFGIIQFRGLSTKLVVCYEKIWN